MLGNRVIGICDSPIGLIRRACRAVGVGEAAVDALDYVGINHLGWLRSLPVGGRDLLPGLLSDDAALESFEEGRLFGGPLLRTLGCLPNEYGYFYYAAIDLIKQSDRRGRPGARWWPRISRGSTRRPPSDPGAAAELWSATRRRREESYLAETRTVDEQRDEADLSGGGYEEVALDVIDAVLSGRPTAMIVNARNGSAVPQLPADMVLEVPCVIDGPGATPLPVAPLDLHQLGLIGSVRASERAVIAAITEGSREEALRAFIIHPLVGSPVIARQLLDGLLADEPSLTGLLQ